MIPSFINKNHDSSHVIYISCHAMCLIEDSHQCTPQVHLQIRKGGSQSELESIPCGRAECDFP